MRIGAYSSDRFSDSRNSTAHAHTTKPSGLVYTSARMYASKHVVSTSSCVDLKELVLTFCFPRVFRGYTEVETDKKLSIPGPL